MKTLIDGGLDLEATSFRNLVMFWFPELKRIMDGESIREVIPERSSRKPLYRYGVIERAYTENGRVAVTGEAQRVLEENRDEWGYG